MNNVWGVVADDYTEGPGCGGSGHDEACLCDVVLTDKAPIIISELADLPYVAGAVRRLGVAVPWNSDDFATVMRIVTHAHDMKQQRLTRKPWLVDVSWQRGDLLDLHEQGHTIEQVMGALGLTFDEWRSTFLPTRTNALHAMTLEDWRDVETTVRACVVPLTVLAERHGMPYDALRDAVYWLGLGEQIKEQSRRNGGPNALRPEEAEQMRAWIRDGLPPREVVQRMRDTFNVTITRSAVSHTRRRMAQKGDL